MKKKPREIRKGEGGWETKFLLRCSKARKFESGEPLSNSQPKIKSDPARDGADPPKFLIPDPQKLGTWRKEKGAEMERARVRGHRKKEVITE